MAQRMETPGARSRSGGGRAVADQQQILDPGKPVKKKRTRRERDAYYTPDWATATLIERVKEIGGDILDPCCGDGRTARALLAANRVLKLRLNDIDPLTVQRVAADPGLRGAEVSSLAAADPALYLPRPCWVVTNPWEGSGAIAWRALQHARRGVALLLRITWLEPCAGREWLRRLPPTRVIVLPRICYDGSGQTDSATSAWFIWHRASPPGTWRSGGIEVAGGDVGQEALQL